MHAIANPKTTLDVLGGINYTRETYNGTVADPSPSFRRNLPGLTFSEVFMHKFGSLATLNETASIYPDLDDLSQYRASCPPRSDRPPALSVCMATAVRCRGFTCAA